jgi:hypothetical protein
LIFENAPKLQSWVAHSFSSFFEIYLTQFLQKSHHEKQEMLEKWYSAAILCLKSIPIDASQPFETMISSLGDFIITQAHDLS